jgi:hypothetical protein
MPWRGDMRQLIVAGAGEHLLQRLAKRGLTGSVIGAAAPAGWTTLASVEAAEQLPADKLWLCALPSQPLLAPDDILINLSMPSGPAGETVRQISLALQDSPFAVDHGFLMAAGGSAQTIRAAATLLDTLAPMPAGWLHAGGLRAPAFMAQLAQELGGSLANLASLMTHLPVTGAQPLFLGQQALMQRLAAYAQRYLADNDDAGYQPAHAVPPAFAPFESGTVQAPALQLAKLLVWMAGNTASASPS